MRIRDEIRNLCKAPSHPCLAMLHVLLLASTALTTRLGPARLRGHRCSAPQAKVGHRFTSLPTADDYTQLLKGASDEDINVVKFTAPWCNTCRASAA